MFRLLIGLIPESALLEWGRWDEVDGSPMNAWAEEFDRRDRAAALARKDGEPVNNSNEKEKA